MYADDVDYVSLSDSYLEGIQQDAVPILGEVDLVLNVDKLEHTIIGHHDMCDQVSSDLSTWRKTRKLGSLLGVDEDVTRRIQLAQQSLDSLEALWKRPGLVSECIRIQSYVAIEC